MQSFVDFHKKVVTWEKGFSDRENTTDELHERFEYLKKAITNSLSAIEQYVEKVSNHISRHQTRVTEISEKLAEYMDLSFKQKLTLRAASKLHDIGKICIPEEILNKPGSLTQLEYDIARFHPYIGYKVISKVKVMEETSIIVLQHHERVDGTGYPDGLKGHEIDIGAKILAVADVLEAMTSPQPYRFPHSIEKTLKEIIEGKDKLYDSEVVEACVKLIEGNKIKL
ncbi:MAG: HD domain-containing phosphohydrolase [candidate division WOR-3 bacterium]